MKKYFGGIAIGGHLIERAEAVLAPPYPAVPVVRFDCENCGWSTGWIGTRLLEVAEADVRYHLSQLPKEAA